MENDKKPTRSGKTLRTTGAIAALLLTAFSLSACIVAADDDYRGYGHRRHHWNNDGDWNNSADWQGNGGHWKRHH
jgi:Spy/CpxP family protein refolding chaperone